MTEYEKYFEKIYEFKSSKQCALPNKIFESSKWFIPELQDKKQELNKVKSQLGRFQLKVWSKHTAYRDPSGFVIKKLSQNIQPELLTQAWCKFYEILGRFLVVPQQIEPHRKFLSLHLCEAPGAFVCALNHYLVLNYPHIKWKWLANTLNPNYEGNELSQMIPDDRFIRYTVENWHFGLDFSGDITRYYNHYEIIKDFENEKVDLVTADGSVDCMVDPGEQERHVEFLHYCETITALAVLQAGGTFVLKIFTIFEDTTICLLFLLNCLFEKVTVFKPCTSKGGNSEVYVINTNFKGFHNISGLWPKLISIYNCEKQFSLKSMLSLSELPNYFLEEIQICTDFFMKRQTCTILDNIYFFENKIKSESNKVYITKTSVAQLFMSLYKLNWIPNDKKIVPHVSVGDNWRVHPVHSSRDYKCIPVENLIKRDISPDIIDIRVGKQIDVVQNSKFTHKDNLRKVLTTFGDRKVIKPSLYEHVLRRLSNNNEIININEFHLHVYHRFQRDFFYRVYRILKEKGNIIFINVPFHTHFLVGLMYILFQAFEKVYFGNGVIILYKSKAESLSKVTELLALVDSAYNEIDNRVDNDTLFASDIIQIIPPNLFDEAYSSIVGLIWNYNNQMFARNACTSRHLSHFQFDT